MYKQVIIVRKDLKWGKGKLAAHVAHASFGAAMKSPDSVVKPWHDSGGKKIVLKIEGDGELEALEKLAKKEHLPCSLIRDAGKTQLKAGTVTALGLGPAKEADIDRITKKLKLL